MYVFLSSQCEFWTIRAPIGEIMHFLEEAGAKEGFRVRRLESLERDLERGKPLFRRKRGKVRNLDDSGHKCLAD